MAMRRHIIRRLGAGGGSAREQELRPFLVALKLSSFSFCVYNMVQYKAHLVTEDKEVRLVKHFNSKINSKYFQSFRRQLLQKCLPGSLMGRDLLESK